MINRTSREGVPQKEAVEQIHTHAQSMPCSRLVFRVIPWDCAIKYARNEIKFGEWNKWGLSTRKGTLAEMEYFP